METNDANWNAPIEMTLRMAACSLAPQVRQRGLDQEDRAHGR